MNQELILKELDDARARHLRMLKNIYLSQVEMVQALEDGAFRIDWQRFDYENPVWRDAVVFTKEEEVRQTEKEVNDLYRELRAAVVLDVVTDLPKLKEFLAA